MEKVGNFLRLPPCVSSSPSSSSYSEYSLYSTCTCFLRGWTGGLGFRGGGAGGGMGVRAFSFFFSGTFGKAGLRFTLAAVDTSDGDLAEKPLE